MPAAARAGAWAFSRGILPGDDPGGFVITALIGIAGALVGGSIASGWAG